MQKTSTHRMSSLRAWLFVLLAAAAAHGRAADAEIEKKAEACAGCHGPRGQAVHPTWPSLAGQSAAYIHQQLLNYREGRRKSDLMRELAKALSPQDLQALAGYYAAQTAMASSGAVDATKVQQGRAIAAGSQCIACHQTSFNGNREVPLLAGQQVGYLVKRLKVLRAGERAEEVVAVHASVRGFSDQQIEALAQYISSQNRAAPAAAAMR
jgi:cytochrome c553